MELLRSRRTRGHFEELHADDRVCRVSGWMLNPSTPVDVFEVLADGKLLTTAAPDTRPDVKRLYAWIPHASRSGFQFALPVVDADLLVVRGKTGGEVSTELRASVHRGLPCPTRRGDWFVGSPGRTAFKCFERRPSIGARSSRTLWVVTWLTSPLDGCWTGAAAAAG